MYALLGVVRVGVDVDATYYSRYSYLSGILAMLGLRALLGRPAAAERAAATAGARRPAWPALVALSLVWNVDAARSPGGRSSASVPT